MVLDAEITARLASEIPHSPGLYDGGSLFGVIMDFRQIILNELARQGKSRYWLAEACADQVSRRTTYGYLAGENRITDDKLAVLLDAMGLYLKQQG